MGLAELKIFQVYPGNVGAVPVQNIGAYGAEAKDIIPRSERSPTTDGKVRIFNNEECNFGYRSSIFKTTGKGRYLVTRVYFRLAINHNPTLATDHLKEEVCKTWKTDL